MRSPTGRAPGLWLTLLAEPAPAKAGVVGFLSVCKIRLRCFLLAASLSFESEMVSFLEKSIAGTAELVYFEPEFTFLTSVSLYFFVLNLSVFHGCRFLPGRMCVLRNQRFIVMLSLSFQGNLYSQISKDND
jgi:hypothetical protein